VAPGPGAARDPTACCCCCCGDMRTGSDGVGDPNSTSDTVYCIALVVRQKDPRPGGGGGADAEQGVTTIQENENPLLKIYQLKFFPPLLYASRVFQLPKGGGGGGGGGGGDSPIPTNE
jgi:hypothetical protein